MATPRAGNECGVQRAALAPAAGPLQPEKLGTHAAAQRQWHHLRRHHSGLRGLRRWERLTTSSFDESTACRHHPTLPALLRRPHGPFHPRGLRKFQIRQQDYRPVHKVDRRILAGEQELRLRLLSPDRHINCHRLRWPSHSLSCRQRRRIHERSVQAGLLGNGNHSGVCGHQHASAKWHVRARWPDPLQYGALPSRRQWISTKVVGRAHAYCGLT